MTDTLIGKTIGKYEIVEHLGRGGAADVYKAYQPMLDRYVALKFMHAFFSEEEDSVGRFQREAKVIASLRHPNIVQVYDFDIVGGIYYLIMEFIDGYTLKVRLHELAAGSEIMPLDEAMRVIRELASALSYAHSRSIIHRDVKPGNVMISRENQVVLTDFGIAKILGGLQYTISGAMVGTPDYMSPEQALGKSGDARSDIYSLGAMFFQMVTGQLPYDADAHAPLAVVLKHINDPLPSPAQLNPALLPGIESIIFKAMAKNPDDRYQTADEIVEHLEWVKAGVFIPDVPAPASPETIIPDPAREVSALISDSSRQTSFPTLASYSEQAVQFKPYILSSGNIAASPADLPAVCDADWNRAVDQFSRGYVADWLREGVNSLREIHLHGLADDLELIAARAEALVQQVQGGDDIVRNAGLEEFLESLGTRPPIIEVVPKKLILPAAGIGETGQPVTLSITNRGRGYLFGVVTSQAPWLRVLSSSFGCAAGETCHIMVQPNLDTLPAGRPKSARGLRIRSNGGDQFLAAEGEVLPAVLEVDAASLDFGAVGQGKIALKKITLCNSGHGYLTGRVVCRAPWLTSSPERFKASAGEEIQVMIKAETGGLPLGKVNQTWAMGVESSGGYAILDVQVEVLSPRLEVEPARIDLGIVDLDQSGGATSAELAVRNVGPGVLAGKVEVEVDWLVVEPTVFNCRMGEAQQVRLSTTRLRVGDHHQLVRVVSNGGVAEIPLHLQVSFSLEPEMALVPAGEFLRGCAEGDKVALAHEKPQRQITLSEYQIAKYSVTNRQYAAFVGCSGRRPPEHWGGSRPPEGIADHPVVNVSWYDALAYCYWLEEVTGKPYRLPTEAQWEKAARGTDGQAYPWGNRWKENRCNAGKKSKGGTTPVSAYSPAGDSPYGCADMAGNVWEWVADWYDATYYAHSSVSESPYGPASGAVKALRGGGWQANPLQARCSCRFSGDFSTTSPAAGFRCAMNPR